MAVLLGTITGITNLDITLDPVGGAGSIETDENKVGNVVVARNKNSVDNTDGEWDGIEITFTDANDDEHGFSYEVTSVDAATNKITIGAALKTGGELEAGAIEVVNGVKVWKTYEGAHNTEDQHNQLRLLGHI